MPFSFAYFEYDPNNRRQPCTTFVIGDQSSRFVCYFIDLSRIFRIPARWAQCSIEQRPARPPGGSNSLAAGGNKKVVLTAAPAPDRRCPP
jgi:hypothetical protein